MVGYEEIKRITFGGITSLFKKVRSLDAPDLIVLLLLFITLPKMYFNELNSFLRFIIIVGFFIVISLYLWFRHNRLTLKIQKISKNGRKNK